MPGSPLHHAAALARSAALAKRLLALRGGWATARDTEGKMPFQLVPDKTPAASEAGLVLGDLEKPYLRTTSALSIAMLTKFLRHKLKVKQGDIVILCKGVILRGKETLVTVHRSQWKDQPAHVMLSMSYRLKADHEKIPA